MQKPRVTELAATVGISKGYASDILSGKQSPSRPLAICIFRKLGWRHQLLADLTETQIEALEAVEPWTPQATRTAAGKAA